MLMGMLVGGHVTCAHAQEASGQPKPASTETSAETSKTIRFQARAADADELVSGKYTVKLWGVERIEGNSALFKLKSRTALENKIGNRPVQCHVKSRKGQVLSAQCENAGEEDLSLFMIQQGYVSVDRAAIYGSLFEAPYLKAEIHAQEMKRGIWSPASDEGFESDQPLGQGVIIGAVILLFVLVVALGAISVFIMRGFHNVVDVQHQTIDIASRERSLRKKEKYVIASMLDAEIKTNKNKIEAYLTIYEEMLEDFKDVAIEPKYKKSGDIVQKQPALSRSVFDGNTDKLDLLGHDMASTVIHYYARIKTIPDYVTLEPETPIDVAKTVITQAVENAQKLDHISSTLLERFVKTALISSNKED